MKRFILVSCVISGLGGTLCAQTPPLAQREPKWWSQPATSIWSAGRLETGNRAPANVGQLKHCAKAAKIYLDSVLAPFGGAGPEITALVSGFQGGPGSPASEKAANALPANVGQLKAVSDLFYRRLAQLGFTTLGQETAARLGASSALRPGMDYHVPWTATAALENSSMATIGQLKIVFGFELDSDADGILDFYELSLINADPNDALTSLASITGTNTLLDGDLDGDGLTNGEELMLRTNIGSRIVAGSPNASAPAYDALDRLAGLAGPAGTSTYGYDNAGNILSSQHSP